MPLECALFYHDSQGIKGSNIKGGREDSSAVIEFKHEVRSPRDPHSGAATGARIHTPIRVLKPIDKASSLLAKALATNQVLEKLEIKWYEVVDGVETEYYHHIITNATVVLQEQVLLNTKDPGLERMPHVEWLAFAYQKIEWTWLDGGLTHEDDWRAPAT